MPPPWRHPLSLQHAACACLLLIWPQAPRGHQMLQGSALHHGELAQMLLTCASKNQNHLPVSAGALNAAGISAGVLSGMLGILLLLLSPHVAPAMP